MSHQQGKDVPRGYSAAYHQVAGGAQQKDTNKLAPVHSFATTQKSTLKSKSDYAAHARLLMSPRKHNVDCLIQQQESNVLMMKPNNNERKSGQSSGSATTSNKPTISSTNDRTTDEGRFLKAFATSKALFILGLSCDTPELLKKNRKVFVLPVLKGTAHQHRSNRLNLFVCFLQERGEVPALEGSEQQKIRQLQPMGLVCKKVN